MTVSFTVPDRLCQEMITTDPYPPSQKGNPLKAKSRLIMLHTSWEAQTYSNVLQRRGRFRLITNTANKKRGCLKEETKYVYFVHAIDWFTLLYLWIVTLSIICFHAICILILVLLKNCIWFSRFHVLTDACMELDNMNVWLGCVNIKLTLVGPKVDEELMSKLVIIVVILLLTLSGVFSACGRAEYLLGQECCPMCAPGKELSQYMISLPHDALMT